MNEKEAYVELDIDKIRFAGNTEEERKLNRMLFETTLELNGYQDAFGNMRTIDELKERLENRKILVHEEYIPEPERNELYGEIKALEWVLNGSMTSKERDEQLPKATKEDVEKIVKNFNEQYKQLSLEDLGVDLSGKEENS